LFISTVLPSGNFGLVLEEPENGLPAGLDFGQIGHVPALGDGVPGEQVLRQVVASD
jgi:hypothetical protein